jgi:hypothetical protein
VVNDEDENLVGDCVKIFPNPVIKFDLVSTMQDFFDNVLRYPRYLIALTVGVFWNSLEPLVAMFKRPTTAIALVGILVSTLIFLTFTLQAMLGLSV